MTSTFAQLPLREALRRAVKSHKEGKIDAKRFDEIVRGYYRVNFRKLDSPAMDEQDKEK